LFLVLVGRSEKPRPERLFSRLKSVTDDTSPRVSATRQPRGPDGTTGFKAGRPPWTPHSSLGSTSERAPWSPQLPPANEDDPFSPAVIDERLGLAWPPAQDLAAAMAE
jgi:SUZ-C motif